METQTPSNLVEPTVLLFETSPDGSLDAIVQQDPRTIYLYLNGRDERFGTRACWVRNLAAAPIEMSRTDLEQGIPPVLPRFLGNHPNGAPAPTASDLRIVWFEEGNGIALFEKDALLAVIPPWSGREGFHGFARDCLNENDVCWPLPPQPALLERIRRAKDFWESWKTGDSLGKFRDELLSKYRQRFGRAAEAYEVDREHWPPLWIYRVPTESCVRLFSVGMSLRPQPNVELSQERPASFRRIELGLEFRPGLALENPAQGVELLAGQARYPWRNWTWLGHGHLAKLTRPAGQPWNLLFVSDRQHRGELIRYRDDPVKLLWIVPISDEEAVQASADVNAVIQRCMESGRLSR